MKAVEKSNAKAAEKAGKKASWWNAKRFKTEKEALLYRSEKAERPFFEAMELIRATRPLPYDAAPYTKARALFAKAAKLAKEDDDVVSHSLYDSMDLDWAEQLHKERIQQDLTIDDPSPSESVAAAE